MQKLLAVLAILMLTGSIGCIGSSDHPDVGRVTGVVTLDGEPLADAVLTFEPMEEARPSYGKTDSSGRYELYYTDDNPGATIGKHRVRITTASSGGEDEAPTPEKLAAKYNMKTELSADVAPGKNTIDFPLESGGEIIEETDGGR